MRSRCRGNASRIFGTLPHCRSIVTARAIQGDRTVSARQLAMMKSSGVKRLCALPYGRRWYGSVHSTNRYEFRSVFAPCCRQLQRPRAPIGCGLRCPDSPGRVVPPLSCGTLC